MEIPSTPPSSISYSTSSNKEPEQSKTCHRLGLVELSNPPILRSAEEWKEVVIIIGKIGTVEKIRTIVAIRVTNYYRSSLSKDLSLMHVKVLRIELHAITHPDYC